MLEPETYNGYDSNNEKICYCTAEDANNKINPSEIEPLITKAKTTLKDGLDTVWKELDSLVNTASTAVIVNGASMAPAIDDTINYIKTIPPAIDVQLDAFYDEVVSVHDQIQQQFNDQAKNAVLSTSGVEHV